MSPIEDLKRRHPGEDLRSPIMIALETAVLEIQTGGREGGQERTQLESNGVPIPVPGGEMAGEPGYAGREQPVVARRGHDWIMIF